MMKDDEKVFLERHKSSKYTVNYREDGKNLKYVWNGAKGNHIDVKAVPKYVYDYLSNFNTFVNGELIVSNKMSDEQKEELRERLADPEAVDDNTFTKEDIIKILSGSFAKMKSTFDKVTSQTTKMFILDVAKEIKLDNANKQKYIKDLVGTAISIEDLFGEEE